MTPSIKDIDHYELLDLKHFELIEQHDDPDHLMAIVEYKEAIVTLSSLIDENISAKKYRQAQIYQAQVKHLDHKICNHLCCLE